MRSPPRKISSCHNRPECLRSPEIGIRSPGADLSLTALMIPKEDAMPNEKRFQSQPPPRMPLVLEFHYEVDDRGDSYRVWEEQLHEPVGIGGDLDHFDRRLGQ